MRSLPGQPLPLEGEPLCLRPSGSLWIDVDAFESAAAVALGRQDVAAYHTALDLYTGDLLLEDLYEDWATDRRERALSAAGFFAWGQGDYDAALTFQEMARAELAALGDGRGVATALLGLGQVARAQGDDRQAGTLYEERLALYRAVDDPSPKRASTEKGRYEGASSVRRGSPAPRARALTGR